MSEDYGNASELRVEIGHPVVDADGHWIETAPVMKDFFQPVPPHVRHGAGKRLLSALVRSLQPAAAHS